MRFQLPPTRLPPKVWVEVSEPPNEAFNLFFILHPGLRPATRYAHAAQTLTPLHPFLVKFAQPLFMLPELMPVASGFHLAPAGGEAPKTRLSQGHEHHP